MGIRTSTGAGVRNFYFGYSFFGNTFNFYFILNIFQGAEDDDMSMRLVFSFNHLL